MFVTVAGCSGVDFKLSEAILSMPTVIKYKNSVNSQDKWSLFTILRFFRMFYDNKVILVKIKYKKKSYAKPGTQEKKGPNPEDNNSKGPGLYVINI